MIIVVERILGPESHGHLDGAAGLGPHVEVHRLPRVEGELEVDVLVVPGALVKGHGIPGMVSGDVAVRVDDVEFKVVHDRVERLQDPGLFWRRPGFQLNVKPVGGLGESKVQGFGLASLERPGLVALPYILEFQLSALIFQVGQGQGQVITVLFGIQHDWLGGGGRHGGQ